MNLRITCECGKFLRVDEKHIGKKVRCPSCRRVIAVEATPPETARAPERRPPMESPQPTGVRSARPGANSPDPPPPTTPPPSPAVGPAARPTSLLSGRFTLLGVAFVGLIVGLAIGWFSGRASLGDELTGLNDSVNSCTGERTNLASNLDMQVTQLEELTATLGEVRSAAADAVAQHKNENKQAETRIRQLENVVQTKSDELTAAQKALVTAKQREEELQASVKLLKEENSELKQTPRYFFDIAAVAESGADSDEKDAEAIEKYAVIVQKFPTDPLAKEAEKRIAAVKRRIADRAEALINAQAEVVRLIAVCEKEERRAEKISDDSLRFDRVGNLDMNRAMAGERKSKKHHIKARKAIDKVLELLENVPDPDGKLRARADRCDPPRYDW